MAEVSAIPIGIYRISSAARYYPELYLERHVDMSIRAAPLDLLSDAQKWIIKPDQDGTYNISCVGDESCIMIQTALTLRGSEEKMKKLWSLEARGTTFIIGNAYDNWALSLNADNTVQTFKRCNVREQRWLLHLTKPLDGSDWNSMNNDRPAPPIPPENTVTRAPPDPSTKYKAGSKQWSHYFDRNRVIPSIRLTQPNNLYVNFHFFENPNDIQI